MANQPRLHLIRYQYNALNMAMRKREIPQVCQAVATCFSRIGKGIDQREKINVIKRLLKAIEIIEQVQLILTEFGLRKKMLQPNGTHRAIFDDGDMSC